MTCPQMMCDLLEKKEELEVESGANVCLSRQWQAHCEPGVGSPSINMLLLFFNE